MTQKFPLDHVHLCRLGLRPAALHRFLGQLLQRAVLAFEAVGLGAQQVHKTFGQAQGSVHLQPDAAVEALVVHALHTVLAQLQQAQDVGLGRPQIV